MTICACGNDVTGKKFCSSCGASVQVAAAPVAYIGSPVCPRCSETVQPGAAFCMGCGTALKAQAAASSPAVSSAPPTHSCSACHTVVAVGTTFCTNCGHDMRAPATAPSGIYCVSCGTPNAATTKFCSNCGSSLGTSPLAAQTSYGQSSPYQQPSQYQQSQPYPQAPQYQPYQQPQYTQYPQPYAQPGQPMQPQPYSQQFAPGGYQPAPMLGQGQMVLRCPTCMAMAPVGTQYCVSCRTSLAGIVPAPSSMPVQGQQGGIGGFLQGSGGQLAAGALGGAAAVIGGQMLLHGLENAVEGGHHGQHHEGGNLLGDLGQLADDVGLI